MYEIFKILRFLDSVVYVNNRNYNSYFWKTRYEFNSFVGNNYDYVNSHLCGADKTLIKYY